MSQALHQWRTEDDQSDPDRRDCRDQDHARRNVFRGFCQGMKVGGREVHARFERGVQAFQDQDARDGEQQDSPFGAGDAELER